MLIKLNSASLIGIEGLLVTIEVNISNMGFPKFEIVGLPNKAVSESKERIIAAIKNSGFKFPNKKITVNLSPADIPKNGSNYDLPIALGILSIENNFSIDANALYAGELSLNGNVAHTRGGFVLGGLAAASGLTAVYVAPDAATYAKLSGVNNAFGVNSLVEIVGHFNSTSQITPCNKISFDLVAKSLSCDVPEIFGQHYAKRALTIAAAGGHHLLMMGPPGSGKSLLGKYLQHLLPPLTASEALEVVKIHSLDIYSFGMSLKRPFRSPHSSTSSVGLLGGGKNLAPGEVTFAHNGVLFLDEFLEFAPNAINSLRQPLEEGYIKLVRHVGTANLPAKFIFVAACNACPCGYALHPNNLCKCTPTQILRYKSKLSGPILDRIDLHILVKPLAIKEVSQNIMSKGTTHSVINVYSRVIAARRIQEERLGEFGMKCNAEMNLSQIRKFCILDSACQTYFTNACTKLNITGRGYFKLLRVARTIADLENMSDITKEHLAEAFQYRFR